MANLKKNVLNLLLIQVFTFVIPILQFPYITRVLGIDNFSMYVYALALMQFANIVTEYGFTLYLTQKIAGGENTKKEIGRILTSSSKIRLIILSLTAIVYYLVITYLASYTNKTYFNIIFIGVIFEAFSLMWYYQATEKIYLFSRITVATRCVSVGLVFLLIKSPSDIDSLAYLTILPSIVTFLVSYYMLWKENVWFEKTTSQQDKLILFESFPFFLTKLSVSFYTTLTTVILGTYGSKEQVAYFGVAARIYSAIQSLVSVLNQALYPYMVRTKNYKILYRVLMAAVIGGLIGVVGSYYFGEWVIYYFAGAAYLPAKSLLDMFMIIALISTTGLLMGYPALAPIDKAKFANYSVMVAGCIQLLLLSIIILINVPMTAKLIILSIAVSESSILAIRLYAFFKNKEQINKFKGM